MLPMATGMLAAGAGGIIGLALALLGGGGSILAVPLLVYVVGVRSPHIAIGTSAVAVSASAAINLLVHWRRGNVKWPCAMVFAAAGVLGALAGAIVAKALDGQKLLFLFGLLMLVVGFIMVRKRGGAGNPEVRLTIDSARQMLPALLGTGLCAGLLAGFFGIGGGFLIVPGLIWATGMPLTIAIGTSLVAVTAFGMASAASYAASGMVDWPLAGLFILGGLAGGLVGISLGRSLAGKKQILGSAFAGVVILAGLYILVRSIASLSA
jgi:uncharacterized membrane protein YfcA